MKEQILDYLKVHGDSLDSDISSFLRVPQSHVSEHISELCTSGDLICCKVTRYTEGKPTESVACRLRRALPSFGTAPKTRRGRS